MLMAVSSVLGVLSKNVCTRHLMLRRNMNRSEVESRYGFALSEAELKRSMSEHLLSSKKGQSLHHIAVHHADELMKSERTQHAAQTTGYSLPGNIDIPFTPYACVPRKNVSSKLKLDKSCRIGRDFHCFEIYMAEHPDASVRQLDSVKV